MTGQRARATRKYLVRLIRNEPHRLANDCAGSPQAEYLPHLRLGVDGLFPDFSDTAIAARAAYLSETGR